MLDKFLSHIDGKQPVVLRRPGSDFETIISDALLRPLRRNRQSTPREDVLPTKSGRWYISHENKGFIPLEGDEIEDRDANRWTIVEVQRNVMTDLWQCTAKMYAIPFGLDEYVDHLRATYSKGEAGTLQIAFLTLKTGIASKFSPSTLSFDNSRTEVFFALVREAIEAECGDLLRRADGSLYKIDKIQVPIFRAGWTEIQLTKKE